MRALQLRDATIEATVDQGELARLKAFKASNAWVDRFKKRHGYVSRRHTTAHSLPQSFKFQSINFIKEVQEVCATHNITRDFIINFDQVPRYYESNLSSTIAKKGTREILLHKSATSHKRFTFTPFITLKHIDQAVNACRGIFPQKSVLVILDSYGTHLKFVRENKETYIARKVFLAVIPPRLTGLIQPLDVAINRSFQQFFNDQTNEYQNQSLLQGINKTK